MPPGRVPAGAPVCKYYTTTTTTATAAATTATAAAAAGDADAAALPTRNSYASASASALSSSLASTVPTRLPVGGRPGSRDRNKQRQRRPFAPPLGTHAAAAPPPPPPPPPAPRKHAFSLSRSLASVPLLSPLAGPLDSLCRLFPPAAAPSALRTSRSLRHALRKASYLHILVLPALLLLFLEVPSPAAVYTPPLAPLDPRAPGVAVGADGHYAALVRPVDAAAAAAAAAGAPTARSPAAAFMPSLLSSGVAEGAGARARAALAPLARAVRAEHAVQPGISIVASCMNRHETLRAVLRDWRAVANVSEILIVDWSSEPPLRDVVERAAEGDPRVRLLRVDGESQWVLSRAYNLAVRATSFDRVIRMDCDYTLKEGFVRAHDLGDSDGEAGEEEEAEEEGAGFAEEVVVVVEEDGRKVTRRRRRRKAVGVTVSPRFYAGNYHYARNENEVHLNGAVYIRRADFLKVGGYDERIQTYGWDDEDLYTRLEEAGVQKFNISYDYIGHVPHADTVRAQRDVKFVQVEIDLNSLLLRHLPKWNSTALDQNEWALADHASSTDTYAVLRAALKPSALKDLVARANVEDAWNTALGQRLANDYQVPWDIMQTMNVESKRTLLTRLNARMTHRSPNQPARVLFAHCMHGLGNRLRALGSAMAFANRTDRELVVIWEIDAHIAASYADLFQDDAVVITDFRPTWPFKDYDKYDKAWLNFEFYNYMEMEGQGAVKGQTIVDNPDKHFYFKSAYVMEADDQLTNWDRDNEMLRSLRPVDSVAEQVRQHQAKGLDRMVGIHIRDRTLDRDIKNVNFDNEYGSAASKEMEYWRRKSSYRTFIAEMERMEKQDPSLRFYVATDTVEVIPKLEAAFPGKIVSTARNCDGRDGHCVRFALVDIICLSKTKELIGSNWSSFTEAASRFGGLKPRLAGEDFAVDANKTV